MGWTGGNFVLVVITFEVMVKLELLVMVLVVLVVLVLLLVVLVLLLVVLVLLLVVLALVVALLPLMVVLRMLDVVPGLAMTSLLVMTALETDLDSFTLPEVVRRVLAI